MNDTSHHDHDHVHDHESPAVKRKFLFLLGSARTGGNTETLAREAAAQLPATVEQRWLRLHDVPLPAFDDRRHGEEGHTAAPARSLPAGNERILLDATLEATDLVIASPLYWYSVSADTKLYLDYWAGWLQLGEEVRFRDRMRGKTMWALTTTSHDDTAKADPLLGTLRLSAEYMGMEWGGDVVGHGNRPGEIRTDTDALAAAKGLFASAM
ncbi:flavodoxin family protein [Streptomyces griseocarneus]|uniref:flavodoxin family protein n=1 Tax=Streptomyces griseocarneus TaxID=51201 RepID=UPI00167EEDBE|nr:NAD(P)H-dependent oxidoreductase [Streptomyces griseocarneus]MBZ6473946.1 NAD(P)H-dependent oxidoreductase [Streptomyces griseocarneus]GHG66046.1 flavodoxin [Streptomyces griseocarneus]